MAKIEGIRVKNFRGLKDVTLGRLWNEPESEPLTAMTVVIGKNGVGKSTLFDVFGFLADALKFGVEDACDSRGGFEKICSQGQTGAIELEIIYREGDDTHPIAYEIYINVDSSGRPFVQGEFLSQRSDKDFLFFLLLSNGQGLTLKDEGKKINADTAKKSGFDFDQFLKVFKAVGEVQKDARNPPVDALNQRAIKMGVKGVSNNNYGIFNKINTMEMNIFSFFNFLPQSLPI
jgi:predicted ATPase